MSQVTVEQLQTMIDDNPYVKLLGTQVIEVGKGTCRLSLPFQEHLLQYYRIVHGGAIASLADTAMYMAQTTLNGLTKNTVTTEMKINYLSSARENDIYADARVIKNGRKIIFGDVQMIDTSDTLIAHATISYMRLDYNMRE